VSGYVVCPACGTRIKAGRPFCLKCFELLPDPKVAVQAPLWESLGLSAPQKAMLGGAGVLAVAGLLFVIWETRPVALDDSAVPVARTAGNGATPPVVAVSPTRAPNASDPAASPVEPFEPTIVPSTAQTRSEPADIPSLEAMLASYDQELLKLPDSADLFNRKGQVLERLGRIGEAASCFERASGLSPDSRIYHFNLARAATTLGQPDRAVAAYREVARLQPDDYAGRYSLALALQRKGDDEAAAAEFQKAVALDPSDPNVHLALGVSLERVRRISDAVPQYQQYLAMQPNAADAARLKEHLTKLSGHP
jgi:tetratricopeptide (TPR) repeat protein